MDFAVNGLEAGTRGSELKLERPGTVRATARVACLLPDKPVRAGAADPPPMPVLESGTRARGRSRARLRSRSSSTDGQSRAARDSRWDAARDGVRSGRREKQLDRVAHPRLCAHESDLRCRQRSAGSGVSKERGLVPAGGRSVLVAEIAALQRRRARGGAAWRTTTLAHAIGRSCRSARWTDRQKPLGRSQKLSSHLPPGGMLCSSL